MRAILAVGAALAVAAGPVYYGKRDGARKPAEVEARKIFERIAEYKQIQERGLGTEDSEYWILLNRANAKFSAAVGRAAAAEGRDVVVEKGSESFDVPTADLTDKAIQQLEN